MAQTSTSPDQIQSAKYIECRFGTYDDPSAKLYEGPLDTRYSGSYKTRDRSSDSRSQESLVSRDVSEILTKWYNPPVQLLQDLLTTVGHRFT